MTTPIDVNVRPTAGRGWYVFRSLARGEGLAEANLTKQGFVHFLPKVMVTKRHARRYVTQREWLFPRYGFLLMDLSRDRWRSVNGTYGVEQLVMGVDGPQRISTRVIDTLQAATGADGLFSPDAELLPGAMVRVRQGPLTGTLGILQNLDGRGRVEVLLDLMNSQVRTKIAREWIEVSA